VGAENSKQCATTRYPAEFARRQVPLSFLLKPIAAGGSSRRRTRSLTVNRWILSLCGSVVALGLAISPIVRAFADTPASKNSHADAATPYKAASEHAAKDAAEDADAVAADRRLADTTRYLASEPLEGRGLGTHGLEMAGDYIARQFKEMGLKTDLYDGQPFERITLSLGSEIGPQKRNRLELLGPPAPGKLAPGKPVGGKNEPRTIPLKLGTDFNPLAVGGSHSFDAPAVFVGYGISAKNEKYDDYAGLNVNGKVVIVLRHQPQRSNPHGLFGDHDSPYALFTQKVSTAAEHGAAAIIFCNDEDEIRRSVNSMQATMHRAIDDLITESAAFGKIEHPSLGQMAAHVKDDGRLAEKIVSQAKMLSEQFDPLLDIERAGEADNSNELPVLFCRREPLDKMLKAATGSDLASLEQQIDATGKPQSRELAGWRIAGETDLVRTKTPARNVLAELDGYGPHADETIIVGAHYDHLGYGGFGSMAPQAGHVIHPGADDNASGTAAMLEVARRLAERAKVKKLPRRILFMAFTGEERGLLGSARYVRDSLIPLDKTIAMLNMDMVGRMKDNKLTVYGIDTATEFAPLITRLNKPYGFKIIPELGGFGPSDHASFFAKKIPVLFFFTGLHADYHRPTDTADKLDVPDMRRVADLMTDVAAALAEAPDRPHFFESPVRFGLRSQQNGDRPYFGSIPDFGVESPGGYAISGVTKGGPAEVGGLKGGDIIIRFGDTKIAGLEDFDGALRTHRAGDKVPVRVKREGKEVQLEVTLEPPRG
jgi:hypothetical protein